MDEQAFQTKFTELMNKIKQLPEQDRPTLERLIEEPLTQAERNVVYQTRSYERFRRSFALSCPGMPRSPDCCGQRHPLLGVL